VGSTRHDEMAGHVDAVRARLEEANRAREVALPLCRQVIRSCGSSIRAVHRHLDDEAERHAAEAERALRDAQAALAGHPAVAHAGFLHDAEKEYAEARLTAALVSGAPLPSCDDLGVDATSWLRGLAEAASELRRHLLDRLRGGDLDDAEELLAAMDDAYDALVTVDLPDALTHGLRRTVDALRAVLERTRGDVTTTVLQERHRRSL
jgi:translin